ncbi:MAG: LysR family transcriptional regulator [Oscillospiraceae bacterium]
MSINFEYYKVFYCVAQNGSISGAAHKLFISQPAVSQAIKQLESNLGSSLFFRTPKGVKLTPEGDSLYSYIAQGCDYFLQAESMFKDMLSLESGEIRIGASDMTLKFFLLPYLEKFHKEYPKIKIKVTNAPTPETIENLKNGDIDFGIVSSPVLQNKWMEVYPVWNIQDVFVAGKRFQHLKYKTVTLNELTVQPIIMLEGRTSTRKFIDDFMGFNGLRINPEFELATSELIVEFATRGLGIGCVVKDFSRRQVKEGQLFELNLETPIPSRKMWVINHSKIPVCAAGKKLLMMMEDEQKKKEAIIK